MTKLTRKSKIDLETRFNTQPIPLLYPRCLKVKLYLEITPSGLAALWPGLTAHRPAWVSGRTSICQLDARPGIKTRPSPLFPSQLSQSFPLSHLPSSCTGGTCLRPQQPPLPLFRSSREGPVAPPKDTTSCYSLEAAAALSHLTAAQLPSSMMTADYGSPGSPGRQPPCRRCNSVTAATPSQAF